MPTVTFKDLGQTDAEAEADKDDGAVTYLATVTHGPEHSRLPADWAKPTPYEWSGYDADGSPTLILVSATWSSREIHEYGRGRWESLIAALRARQRRQATARAGGTGKQEKRATKAEDRRASLLHMWNAWTSPEIPVGVFAGRLNVTQKTVRNDLKKLGLPTKKREISSR